MNSSSRRSPSPRRRSPSPRRRSRSPSPKERSRSPIRSVINTYECNQLAKTLFGSIKFKIILTVIAHGCTEDICKKLPKETKTTSPVEAANDYINNFESSEYVNKINLYSIVPYGINNTSTRQGELSREKKHKFIIDTYNTLINESTTYNKIIDSHIPNSKKRPVDTTEREYQLFKTYGLTIYDILIDNIFNNLTGTYVSTAYQGIATAAMNKPELFKHSKESFHESRNVIDPQIIVKEQYSFSDFKLLDEDENLSTEELLEKPTEIGEYSGLFGIGATYKRDEKDLQGEDVFKSVDFSKIDFTRVLDITSIVGPKVWKTIQTYILRWNTYIETLYGHNISSPEFTMNMIYFQKDLQENPIRIKYINNQSIYHIIFLFLNGLMDTPVYFESEKLLYEFDFTVFLTYMTEHLNVDLYLISNACRGMRGDESNIGLCSDVNKQFSKSQLRLKCKKQGLLHFRRHYIRKSRYTKEYSKGGTKNKRHTRNNKNKCHSRKNKNKRHTRKNKNKK